MNKCLNNKISCPPGAYCDICPFRGHQTKSKAIKESLNNPIAILPKPKPIFRRSNNAKASQVKRIT